jgi:mannose-6-phosphate isomerase-like protein (cupin superfamily)
MPHPPAPPLLAHRPVVIRSDEAEYLTSIGHLLLVDADATAGALSAHRVNLGAGDDGAVPHRHLHSSEMFVVLDGELQVLIDEAVVTARAGDLVVVPPGMAHAFGAPTDSAVEALIVLTPGTARFDYFRHVVRQRAGAQDLQVLVALQERFDTYFLESTVWQAARRAS